MRHVYPARPVEPGTLRVFNWGGMPALWNAKLIPSGRSLFLWGGAYCTGAPERKIEEVKRHGTK